MPQADLKYSTDLDLPAGAILAEIEAVISGHDSGAGACKGRAYPTDIFHHSHLLVEIMMLEKPHRDQAFTDSLLAKLEAAIKSHLTKPCQFSLSLGYNGGPYITNSFTPESV